MDKQFECGNNCDYIMDILIVSRWILIPNVVSIGFALFTDTYMDTYDTTIPNWIKSNVEPISNRYLIILVIVMFIIIFTVIALILRIRQQCMHWNNQYAALMILLSEYFLHRLIIIFGLKWKGIMCH